MTTTTLETITFAPGETITVGMEATISSLDSHPAKVAEIRRVRGGYEVDFQEYAYHGDQTKDLRMGHQDWIIDWDKPTYITTIRLRLSGKLMGKGHGTCYTVGSARAYRCWEF